MIFAVLELCALTFLVTFFATQVLLPLIYRTPICPWFKKPRTPPMILRVPYPYGPETPDEKERHDAR